MYLFASAFFNILLITNYFECFTKVVLAPIAVGMTTKKFFPKLVEAFLPITPVIGVVSTCLLVASAVAQVAEPIMNAGLSLQVSPPLRIKKLCLMFAKTILSVSTLHRFLFFCCTLLEVLLDMPFLE